MRTYKIVLLGSAGVGKSAITFQFIQGIFINSYNPTVEDSYRKVIQVNKHYFLLEILDTAGTEHLTAMRDVYVRNGQGFALIYSITSESTFRDIVNIRNEILRMKENEKFSFILVGNKCDLEKDRVVTKIQGQDLAREFNCPFIETSAKLKININDMFHDLLQQIDVMHPYPRANILKRYCSIL